MTWFQCQWNTRGNSQSLTCIGLLYAEALNYHYRVSISSCSNLLPMWVFNFAHYQTVWLNLTYSCGGVSVEFSRPLWPWGVSITTCCWPDYNILHASLCVFFVLLHAGHEPGSMNSPHTRTIGMWSSSQNCVGRFQTSWCDLEVSAAITGAVG